MIAQRELVVQHPDGLHARPAVRFVRTANRFSSRIQLENLTRNAAPIDAKSLLAVLAAGVEQGHRIRLTADGPDAVAALETLEDVVLGHFELPPDDAAAPD